MNTGIKDKIAIVTGASKGMGRAISLALSNEGAKVCMVSRTLDTLKESADSIKGRTGNEVIVLSGDVSDPELPGKVLKKVTDEWGSVHILVNNAGGPPPGGFLKQTDESWNSAIQQNLMSVVRFTKGAAPYMKNQSWGRIINITSTVAKEPSPEMVLSAAARAGVSSFSKAISSELAPYNITINTICPGGVLTDRLKSLLELSAKQKKASYEELLDETLQLIPMRRFADPEEIANMAVFLSSESSGYLTGASISVDGALTKGIF